MSGEHKYLNMFWMMLEVQICFWWPITKSDPRPRALSILNYLIIDQSDCLNKIILTIIVNLIFPIICLPKIAFNL